MNSGLFVCYCKISLPLDRDVAGTNVLLEELRQLNVSDALGQVCDEESALGVFSSDEHRVLVVEVGATVDSAGDVNKLTEILHWKEVE